MWRVTGSQLANDFRIYRQTNYVYSSIIPCSGCGSFRERSGRFLGIFIYNRVITNNCLLKLL